MQLSDQKIQMIDKRYFICEICGNVFTPASNLSARISSPSWGETINWPQLVSIVAPVSIGKTRDGAHWSNSWPNKKHCSSVFDIVSSINYLNTLFTWAFLLCGVTLWASLRCGKAYVSSRLWFWWNVCHNFFNVFISKAFIQRKLSCASSSCVH